MNIRFDKALSLPLASCIVSVAWISVELIKRSTSRYTIESGGALQRTFLLDRQTGKVWRYYINVDENKKPTDEGFQMITQ